MVTDSSVTRAAARIRTSSKGWLPAGGGLLDEDWDRRHRLLTLLLAATLPLLTVFGVLRDGLGATWLIAALLILPCVVAAVRLPGRRWPSTFVAFGFVVACADFVAMCDGLTEAHFTFFIAIAALALYRDWVPFGAFLVATVVEHAAAGAVFGGGAFDHHDAIGHPLKWALLHGLAVFAAAAFQVIAWRLTESEEERAQDHLNESQAQLGIAFDRLQHQVGHDALTGLLSRAAFERDLVARLTASAEPASVIYLDVDRFKSINDGAGHGSGDQTLRALAARLLGTVPPEALVARLGGDEFVVALPGPLATGLEIGHAILASFADPLPLAAGALQLSLSMGIAIAGGPDQAEAAVLAADTAMYVAKRAGGNRLEVFNDQMRVAVQDRLIAEARLRRALDGDRDATLPVWFQPIVSPAGRILGAEALVRMRTPDGVLRSPGEFIPAAEETGLVVPLGEHVLASALRHLLRWRLELGYVSVNVSPRQLSEPRFVPMLARLLADSGLDDPSRLVLEITETAMLSTSVDLEVRLSAIKDLGVRIALDDFGTGYSSLTWLQTVPADVVKLDRSFVAGLARDPRKASIIMAVLWLARSLNMSVVAEGVEDPDDWNALWEADCPAIQGYLFSKPLPADDFHQLLLRPAGLELSART
jgi:diguanylate cyclase (GGDEF)-like protein